MTFTKSWLGYDLPYDTIEAHPAVRTLRAQGIEKRIKAPEYHVTAGYFEAVSLEALIEFLAKAETERGASFAEAVLSFDGYGLIDTPQGKYAYFSPASGGAQAAADIKSRLVSSSLYDAAKNCRDLHLSIGGHDPFSQDKPKRGPLKQPFELKGRLTFVGNDGKNFRRYFWDSSSKTFIEEKKANEVKEEKPLPAKQEEKIVVETKPLPAKQEEKKPEIKPEVKKPEPQAAPLAIKKIAIFPKIQPDTACAVFLLRTYGEKLFPGASAAEIEFMTALPVGKTADDFEKEGVLLIDLGKSRFDHHTDAHGRRTDCASTMIAKALGIADKPELRKLLQYVKRDDLEGKGTLSTDPLDRAFGLSGLIMTMNRVHAENPQAVLEFVVSVFEAHVFEEHHRQVEMPAEWKGLLASGKGKELSVQKDGRSLRVIGLESDNVSLPGFLRAYAKADVIVQRLGSGHTNVITRQDAKIDLKKLTMAVRKEEAARKNVTLPTEEAVLTKPNHLEGVEEWFYDTAATTLQNGGVRPIGVTPTRIDFPAFLRLVQAHL